MRPMRSAWRVWMLLDAWADHGRYVVSRPSKVIAKRLGIPDRTVRAAIRWLRERRLIELARYTWKRGTKPVYVIALRGVPTSLDLMARIKCDTRAFHAAVLPRVRKRNRRKDGDFWFWDFAGSEGFFGTERW